jgi:rsbT co-antagonist protein RsbR
MTDAPTTGVPADLPVEAMLQSAFDAFTDPVFIKDHTHRWIACNSAFASMLGCTPAALIGRSDPDFFDAELVAGYWQADDELFASGQPQSSEELVQHSDGSYHVSWTRKFPIRGQNGETVALLATITDITDLKRRQEEVARLQLEVNEQMEIVEMQRKLLDEVAVPVIQVWNGILLLPLVGVIESRRALQVMESLLDSIGRTSAQVVIIDITGVPVVDTGVASYLIRAIQAAQLLGCNSILVGISPEIAQTLVGLGIDFSRIQTRATLQNGLQDALRQLNYSIRLV